jgi:hypothetical protein
MTNLIEDRTRKLVFSKYLLPQTDTMQCKNGAGAKLTKREKLPQIHFHQISHISMLAMTTGNLAINLVKLPEQGTN